MNTTILVMTCDAYDDTWTIFNKLFKKYWSDCPFDIYLGTETKQSELIPTIRTTGAWTDRVRKALQQINTDYVILMLDDFFIRQPVDTERIFKAQKLVKDEVAMVSFQNVLWQLKQFLHKPLYIKDDFVLRQKKTLYLCNCQPAIWDRKKLISLLPEGKTAWEWETSIVNTNYKFYANADEHIIDIGYYKERKPWSIVQGKWAREVKDFLDNEGIEVNYEKRGFFD